MRTAVISGKTQYIVEVSEALVLCDPAAEIVTYALGSCLGLAVYDPVSKVGGILHSLLPLSRMNLQKAEENPYMFVDTGVPEFLNQYFELGGTKERMIVKAAGCGNMMDEKGQFNIGHRNHTVLRKILWKNNILIAAEKIGGSDAKTMQLNLATGKLCVKTKEGIVEI